MATKTEIAAAAKLLMAEAKTRVPALQADYKKQQGVLQAIVEELALYGATPESTAKKAVSSVLTPEITEKVTEGLKGKTMTATQFNELLGIFDQNKAGKVREALEQSRVISSKKRAVGLNTYIWLAEEEMGTPVPA